MKTTLVGYTGFVGGNLADAHSFDGLYNSKNIEQAFNQSHELLIYSGVRAEKFLANANPDADKLIIDNAIQNIKKLNPQRLVLISTADVYLAPQNVNENTFMDTQNLQAYGLNRLYLENWVKDNLKNYHIIRLPGLFGRKIKKNFLFDMITITPSMLKEAKFNELSLKSELVKNAYAKAENGFYKLKPLTPLQRAELKNYFLQSDFNALSFTDSRAAYQFYNLANLWGDINTIIKNELKVVNLTSHPVTAAEVYKYVTGSEFKNEISQAPVCYDIRSLYADYFGGENGYMYNKNDILAQIKSGIRTCFE